jgi:hypothetical protein
VSELRRHIERSKRLADGIGEHIEGLELKADDRTRASAALISLSLCHHGAIVQLLDLGRPASALALIRSMIDCLVRAQWVAHLATEQEIKGFIAGNDPPGRTRSLIDRLEKDGPLDEGLLSSILNSTQWAVVCDFNHGGGRMVVRHVGPDGIAPNFKDDELIEAIVAANAWALVSACSLADLAKDNELGAKLMEIGKQLAF